MSVHLQAWYESVDQALGNITPLSNADGEYLMRVNGDNTKVDPRIPRICATIVGSASIEVARFTSASLRATALPYISPLQVAEEPGSPPALVDLRDSPIEFASGEDMQLQVENDAAGSAEDVFGLAWWCDSPPKAQGGAWRTIRATTGASAMTAHDWNPRSVTLDNELRPGTYEIGGAFAIGTSLIAARVIPREDSVFRPGFLCGDAVDDLAARIFRRGAWGTFGRFEHDEVPDIEFFPDAADNEAQEVFLDIRKVN